MQHAYPSVNIGWGAHTMVGNDAKALGMTNALIVTTGLRGTGIVEAIQGVLKAAGVSSDPAGLITMSANTQGLTHGLYQATLTITDPQAVNSPRRALDIASKAHFVRAVRRFRPSMPPWRRDCGSRPQYVECRPRQT
jgi:hypothetical protein